MGMPRALPVGVGFFALLTTSAILIIHIILAGHPPEAKSVMISASVSAALEGVALSVLAWLFSTYFIVSIPDRSKRFVGFAFAVSVMACILATVASVITMIVLNNAAQESMGRVLGTKLAEYMVGASVAVGLAFAFQVTFIVVHFVVARITGHAITHSLHTTDQQLPAQVEVKAVRYDEASSYPMEPANTLTPPGSSSGKSATTIGSLRKSISSMARPLSSKTVLTRERSCSSSISTHHGQEANSEDGFDSWDISAVDPQDRQTVMQSTSPTGRFLETIPASPTNSRSPSPDSSFALDPPRPRTRSRSYSPAGSASRVPRTPYVTRSDGSEAHIHPLFRSDSPTPPPVASPGTMVLASPNAGQVISDRQSIRSLSRMRSGSLPATPSPLSRQGSYDEFAPLRPAARDLEGTPEPSIREEDGEKVERKLTPPIPEWVLSAGTRTSLSDYTRRMRSRGEREEDVEGEKCERGREADI
ncbi:hypothetical protein VUR80DRAFT_4713 [Thermomyces stellatus]